MLTLSSYLLASSLFLRRALLLTRTSGQPTSLQQRIVRRRQPSLLPLSLIVVLLAVSFRMLLCKA